MQTVTTIANHFKAEIVKKFSRLSANHDRQRVEVDTEFGTAEAVISLKELTPDYAGSYLHAPESGNYQYSIEAVNVEVWNTKGEYLPSVSEAVNKLLN